VQPREPESQPRRDVGSACRRGDGARQVPAAELYLNLEWGWPRGVSVPEDGPRDELDEAARLGRLYSPSLVNSAQRASRRTSRPPRCKRSPARCLGRIAVPVVVRVRLGGRPAPEKGAIFFDLAAAVRDDFRARLDEAVQAWRTLES